MPALEFLTGGQQALQVTTPERRVLALTPSPRLRVVENPFDPSTNPRGRFILLVPDRVENGEYVTGRNPIDRLVQDSTAIGFAECRPPLRPMLVVPPLALHRSEKLARALLERRNSFLPLRLLRISTFGNHLTKGRRSLTSSCELHRRIRAYSDRSSFPVTMKHKEPALGPARLHVEIKPTAVAVTSRLQINGFDAGIC